MSDERLAFCLGVHNHQPIGNFDDVVADAARQAYRPFLERVRARPEVRLTVHCTGSLLEWLQEHDAPTFDLLGEVAARGQVELLTGGFYEPVLAILPDADKVGQIEKLSDYLKTSFGVRPRGMWLAERVWEPSLPRALRAAGVEYVLVDDAHFALAGLDPDALGGYYLTEDQGAVVAVFPISQRLRYLIPFGTTADTMDYLAARRGAVRAVTVMDDGEKFGAWPGTHAHVYGEGWLDDFFDRVLAAPWLAMSTFSDVVDRMPPTGRVYLPTASYREMGEWVLPPAAARTLKAAKQAIGGLPDGAHLLPLLRGGFWRGFLVKYPEVADTYWKMLRLSGVLHRERARRTDDPRVEQARTALWRGQANDAYWHGVFGGCYLPHLRRAIKSSLLQAERLLADAAEEPAVSWWRGDGNGDGREEIAVRTPELAVTINPAAGGSVTELGFFARALDLADVLARRPEVYHDQVQSGGESAVAKTISSTTVPLDEALARLLRYDDLRRASLLDGLVERDGAIDPVAPWEHARAALGAARFDSEVAATPDGVAIRMALEHDPARGVSVTKQIDVRGAVVAATYRVRAARAGRWAVQWNLALTAGDAPGRYLRWPGRDEAGGRPSLGSTGERGQTSGVTLVDEWIGVEAELTWSPAATISWGPVETVSVSEAGFERIYQGTALLLLWPLEAGEETEVRVALAVKAR